MKLKDIRYFFRDIKKGIENLIIWLPVIWKDRWWDHWFFYVLLHKKLSLMERNIREYGNHVNSEKDADKIKKCMNLLDRLKDDNYFEIAFKNHTKKWGEADFNWTEIDDSDLVELNITRPMVKTEDDKKIERKEFKSAAERETYLRDQDLDMLFDTMRKNIQTWWD